MKFALIKDGIIDNVIEAKNYRDAQIVAMSHESEAVNIDLYNAGIGYTYSDGNFYTPGGKLVVRQLTIEERLELMQRAFDELALGGL